ncbi:MAG: hypothetical protein J6K16_04225 [Alphaproteobacteria bacterium]|nr:hypothetical protein [Alphaproteobacteria bacterium]
MLKEFRFYKTLLAIVAVTLAVTGCQTTEEEIPVIEEKVVVLNPKASAKIIQPIDPNMIKTTEGASSLDLELPLRCYVNWNTQQMITTLPYNLKAFNLTRNGIDNPMPRFEVTGFSFKTMPAEKALLKLTKEADIKLVAKDAPYASISAENLRGELSDVVKMITDAAEIYYSYNAETKTLTIGRKTNFTLYTPKSRPIILALLDVLRGSGITNVTTDWSDYSLTFDGDYELQKKIQKLLTYFEDNPVLIAYDVSIFKIYPNHKDDVEWQDMLKSFEFGTIKTAKTGVIGRVLTTSNDININTLQSFLGSKASVVQVSEGKFVVPNLWMARFDIGKCAKSNLPEKQLSLLAKSSLMPQNRIFSDITLEGTDGQITQFNIRSKLGENFLIIGIPNEILGVSDKKSETIVFIVPRIIRTIKKQITSVKE